MKKVLAWAVALALVLSSFTMAFADQAKTSANFKDASSINYTEAVDVMVATGVINGYPDGTFGPQKTVKRSEMAKMISVMLEGGKDIGSDYKDACTFADSKDHWAAGYIAYCAAQHIIDGRSADVFDPEKEVTGTEVAKMALTSLGYDSKIQGYVGENWAANVLKDANKIELFDGLADDFVPGNPCSREAAAQILFNTLQANMVEYDNGTSVSVGDDVNVVVSSKIKDQTWKDGMENKIDAAAGTNDGIKQLYEEAFKGKLIKDNSASVKDDFGRPAHDWEFDGDDVGTYDDDADETFVTEKEFASVEAAIKDYNKDYTYAAGNNVFVNGGAAPAKLPAGTTIELTKSKKNVTYVVAYYYELEQIDSVDTEVTASDAEKDVTAYVTVDGKKINDTDLAGYDASTYKEDAYIAVAWNAAAKEKDNSDAVLDSFVPEKVTGEWTKSSKDSIYIDGKAYVTSTAEMDAPFVKEAKVGDEVVDLYLDKNGIALGVVLVESKDDTLYGIFIKSGESKDNYGEGDTVVKVYTAEGEKEFVIDSEVYKDKAAVDALFAPEDSIKIGTGDKAKEVGKALIAYKLNDDGEIKSIEKATSKLPDTGATMKKGLLDKKVVSEDIDVFAYDADEEEWTVKAYADLEAAKDVTGTYFTTDDGIVALYAANLIESTSDTLGFFVEATKYTAKDATTYDVSLYVDGKKESYTTIDNAEVDSQLGDLTALQVGTLVKVSVNSDNKITAISKPTADTKTEPSDSITGDYIGYSDGFVGVLDYNGTSKMLSVAYGADKKLAYTAIADAKVYKLTVNSDNELEIAPYTGKLGAGNGVMLYQLDKESEAWDAVVYITAADAQTKNINITTAEDPNEFTVAVAEDITGGTVTLDKTKAKKGDTITVTVAAADGNEVATVTYTVEGKDPQAIELKEGVYTFEMPEGNVTVSATFTPAN